VLVILKVRLKVKVSLKVNLSLTVTLDLSLELVFTIYIPLSLLSRYSAASKIKRLLYNILIIYKVSR